MKQPWLYQGEAIEKFMHVSGILADECGLGKTLMAIETVIARRTVQDNQMSTGPTLVVCKKHARNWWHDEIHEQDPNATIIVAQTAGIVPEGIDLGWYFHPERVPMWMIVHYDGFRLNWKEYVRHYWSHVILDEAHTIKNRNAKITNVSGFLKSDHRLAITPTPMHKNPAELWAILHWLFPDRFRSYWAFFEQFVDYHEDPYRGYKKIRGAKNLSKLAELIGPIFLRRTKAEVLPELPPLIRQTVHIDLDKAQKELYNRIARAKPPGAEVVISSPDDPMFIANQLAKIVRLQQVLADPAMAPFNQHIASAKLDWVREYISDNPGVPMVIFSKFVEPVMRLALEFKGALLVGRSHRGSSNIDRPSIEHWQAGRVDHLFGTIDAMGESLNLQRASVEVFIDEHWSTEKMTHAYDRVHRADITESKLAIRLEVPGSVDGLVRKSLTEGWTTQQLVFAALKQWEE